MDYLTRLKATIQNRLNEGRNNGAGFSTIMNSTLSEMLELVNKNITEGKGLRARWRNDVGACIEGERNELPGAKSTCSMVDQFWCSWCGYAMYWKTPYCPYCGSKMEGVEDG